MLIQAIKDIFVSYRLHKYKSIFSRIKERQGSLSATEAFCVDVINLLDQPTIKQFSDFIGISQSNATYKINSLIQKGYIIKEVSPEDRREYRLLTTEKFRDYFDTEEDFLTVAQEKMKKKYSGEQLRLFESMLRELSEYTR